MANYNGKRAMSQGKSRRISRQMGSSTIGTHVSPGQGSYRTRELKSGSSGLEGGGRLQSTRRSGSRAIRQSGSGMVSHVTPSTATRETKEEYSRRMGSRGLSETAQAKSKVKKIIAIIVILLLLAGVGIGVGSCTYRVSVGGNMALNDDAIQSALTAPTKGKPYYLLLAADLNPLDGNLNGNDAFLLARVDEDAKAVSLLSIPANIRLRFTDGQTHLASEAPDYGGDSQVITGLCAYLNISIAHYLKTDAAGLADIVDYVGGITVTVKEEVDDPTAGGAYIPVGTQVLDGTSCISFLRAQNYFAGTDLMLENRGQFAAALGERLFAYNEAEFAEAADALSADIKTDLSIDDLLALAGLYRGTTAAQILTGYTPGYNVTQGGVTSYTVDSTSFATVWSQFTAGTDPKGAETTGAAIDPGSVTVTVRNGSGVDGGATAIADILTAAGYKVEEKGNAESFVYEETLVIYKDTAFETTAKNMVSALGCGRTVYDVGFYIFETDVLVVLGFDWKPSS